MTHSVQGCQERKAPATAPALGIVKSFPLMQVYSEPPGSKRVIGDVRFNGAMQPLDLPPGAEGPGNWAYYNLVHWTPATWTKMVCSLVLLSLDCP
jgi:hypothetical protein